MPLTNWMAKSANWQWQEIRSSPFLPRSTDMPKMDPTARLLTNSKSIHSNIHNTKMLFTWCTTEFRRRPMLGLFTSLTPMPMYAVHSNDFSFYLQIVIKCFFIWILASNRSMPDEKSTAWCPSPAIDFKRHVERFHRPWSWYQFGHFGLSPRINL